MLLVGLITVFVSPLLVDFPYYLNRIVLSIGITIILISIYWLLDNKKTNDILEGKRD